MSRIGVLANQKPDIQGYISTPGNNIIIEVTLIFLDTKRYISILSR